MGKILLNFIDVVFILFISIFILVKILFYRLEIDKCEYDVVEYAQLPKDIKHVFENKFAIDIKSTDSSKYNRTTCYVRSVDSTDIIDCFSVHFISEKWLIYTDWVSPTTGFSINNKKYLFGLGEALVGYKSMGRIVADDKIIYAEIRPMHDTIQYYKFYEDSCGCLIKRVFFNSDFFRDTTGRSEYEKSVLNEPYKDFKVNKIY